MIVSPNLFSFNALGLFRGSTVYTFSGLEGGLAFRRRFRRAGSRAGRLMPETHLPTQYLPVLLLLVLAAGFVVINLVMGSLVRPKRPSAEKLTPYESGIPPIGQAQRRFNVRFYLVSMLFVLFDIEMVFIYPWAVLLKKLGMFGFVEMAVFIMILLVGYGYAWKSGALNWD